MGIAVDQADKVAQFSTEIKLNYPTLIGGYGAIELSRTLGNSVGALPFTVVLDRAGDVVYTPARPGQGPGTAIIDRLNCYDHRLISVMLRAWSLDSSVLRFGSSRRVPPGAKIRKGRALTHAPPRPLDSSS